MNARAKKQPPRRSFTIAEARDNLSRLIHQTEAGPVELTRRGESVAVVLSRADYERLSRPSGGAWEALMQFRAQAQDLPTEDLFADVRDHAPGPEVDIFR